MSLDDAPLTAVADALLRWRGTSMLGAKDVLVWTKAPMRVGVAFRGDALRLERAALLRGLRNRRSRRDEYRGELDLALQDALGVDVGQTMSEDDEVHISEVMDGVGRVVGRALEAQVGLATGSIRVDATLMPEQGSPWVLGQRVTPYYSAARGKMLATKAPDWGIEVEIRDHGKKLGADFCKLSPVIEPGRDPHVVGDVRGEGFVVTHSFDMEMRGKARGEAMTVASRVKDCGGLLFPSLAVGMVPATIFGLVVLAADVATVLPSMRPYKKRGAWPVVVYSTDTWTTTTSEVVTHGSVALFEELTGNRTFGIYGEHHFWTLGPPVSEGGGLGAPESFKLVASTRELATAIARRRKKWPMDLTAPQMAALQERYATTEDYYPYLEAKVNGVVQLGCFPLALAPEWQAEDTAQFLRVAGFRGALAPVHVARDVERLLRDERTPWDDRKAAEWHYAWAARDVLAAWAERGRGALQVEEA
jgi:hypothetical protein